MAARRRLSDKLRCYDCVSFKAIPVGGRFRFSSEVEDFCLGMKRGVCEKLSARKYRYVDDGMECQVGSIQALVLRLDAEGEPIRHGEYIPSLRD